MIFTLPSNIASTSTSTVLKQLDNRTTLYFFAEIISYYYGLYLEKASIIGCLLYGEFHNHFGYNEIQYEETVQKILT